MTGSEYGDDGVLYGPPPDHSADATALLADPWQAAAMERRLTAARGGLLVTPLVEALVADVLVRFPQRPRRAQLVAFLTRWRLPVPEPEPAPPEPGPSLVLDSQLTLADVRALLDLHQAELSWFADTQLRERHATRTLQHYRWSTVPKRDGVRLVAEPKPRLKEMQRRLLRHVVVSIPQHDAAHGCVPGRSVRTAVTPHVGARMVIRLDLESFFPSISAGRVRGLLNVLGLSKPVAATVAALCTTAAPSWAWRLVPRPTDAALFDSQHRLGTLLARPCLPQGAPTSPALANAVAYRLDCRLDALAARFGAAYTRYVDDLIFSGAEPLRGGRQRFILAARAIIAAEGFRLAERKTAVSTDAGRLAALGAVFNEHPSLPRPERDRLRAIVHNCVVYGGASQARGRPRFQEQLLGRIGALGALDPVLGARLRSRYDQISWD